MLSLATTLFADDTTIYTAHKDLEQLISSFKKEIEPFLVWVKFNQLE
jgi:hypothetical protein